MEGTQQDSAGEIQPRVCAALLQQFCEVGHVDLQVFGDLLERIQRATFAFAQGVDGVFQAVIDVVLNKGALGLAHCLFHCMQLLRDVHALTAFFDHGDDAAQVTISPFQALDNSFMTLVEVVMPMGMFGHA
jgi:hypothetical protein